MSSKISYLCLIALALFFVSLAAAQDSSVSLEAGDIESESVLGINPSERWVGVVGTVFRGNSSLPGFRIGDVGFSDGDPGEVVSLDIEGIQGGGYYLGFTPPELDLNVDSISGVTASDLSTGGIFSSAQYPSFYPSEEDVNYTQLFDNPNKTFETGETIRIDDSNFEAAYINLSGKKQYLVKYEMENGSETPLFVSPIDALTRNGSEYNSCYMGECDFEALLPRSGDSGSNFTYNAYLLSRGESVQNCQGDDVYSPNSSSLVLDSESAGCTFQIEDDGYVDFYNNEFTEGGSGCGLTIRSSYDVIIRGLTLEDFDSGLCLENSNLTVIDTFFGENERAIRARDDTNLNAVDLELRSNTSRIELENSNISMDNISFQSNSVYGEASSVVIEAYSQILPKPAVAPDNVSALGSRVEIRSNSENPNDSVVEELGLSYPEVPETTIDPTYIYKYDEGEGNVSGYDIREFDVTDDREDRVAYVGQRIENFSVFSLYGNEIPTGNDTEGGGDGDTETGEGESDDDADAGGGGGGSGGSGGGGTGQVGGAMTRFEPEPEAISMNLSMNRSLYQAKRGETVSVAFSLGNTEDLPVENVTVAAAGSSWQQVPRTFESISSGEVRYGTALIQIPQDTTVGNYTLNMQARYRNTVLDQDDFNMSISRVREEQDNVEVREAPSFLSINQGSTQEIGIELNNPTQRSIENVSVSLRGGEECISINETQVDIPPGEDRVTLTVQTGNTTQPCNSVVVLRKDNDVLGFTPMNVRIVESAEELVSVPVYLLLLVIWTSLLVWRLYTRERER